MTIDLIPTVAQQRSFPRLILRSMRGDSRAGVTKDDLLAAALTVAAIVFMLTR